MGRNIGLVGEEYGLDEINSILNQHKSLKKITLLVASMLTNGIYIKRIAIYMKKINLSLVKIH